MSLQIGILVRAARIELMHDKSGRYHEFPMLPEEIAKLVPYMHDSEKIIRLYTKRKTQWNIRTDIAGISLVDLLEFNAISSQFSVITELYGAKKLKHIMRLALFGFQVDDRLLLI